MSSRADQSLVSVCPDSVLLPMLGTHRRARAQLLPPNDKVDSAADARRTASNILRVLSHPACLAGSFATLHALRFAEVRESPEESNCCTFAVPARFSSDMCCASVTRFG
jgi:hypothetical protein